MRRTLFILTKDLIPIMIKATESLRNKRFEDYFKIGDFSEQEFFEYKSKIIKLLFQEELSASELRKKLNSSKSLSLLISILCDQMDLIRGRPIKGWKDRRLKYGLFSNYFPDIRLDNLSEGKAIELLLWNYLKTYSPSTEKDIGWWTGLKKSKITKALSAIEKDIHYVNIDELDGDFLILKDQKKRVEKINSKIDNTLNFLPNSDPFLLGYKIRERYLDPDLTHFVFDRSGNITSTIILNGRIIGVWDVNRSGEKIVKFHLFSAQDSKIMKEIRFQAERIGLFFYEDEFKISEYDVMVPISKRTAGNFMTPLKNS